MDTAPVCCDKLRRTSDWLTWLCAACLSRSVLQEMLHTVSYYSQQAEDKSEHVWCTADLQLSWEEVEEEEEAEEGNLSVYIASNLSQHIGSVPTFKPAFPEARWAAAATWISLSIPPGYWMFRLTQHDPSQDNRRCTQCSPVLTKHQSQIKQTVKSLTHW